MNLRDEPALNPCFVIAAALVVLAQSPERLVQSIDPSGSSSIGPHLHFHVSDASSALAAEGMPFVFRNFIDEGRFASINALTSGEKWLPAGAVAERRDERPDPVTVIRFP